MEGGRIIYHWCKCLNDGRHKYGRELFSPQVAYWSGGRISSTSKYLSWWSILHCQRIYGCWLIWIICNIDGTHGHVNVVVSKDANSIHNWFSNEIAFYDHYIIPLVNRLKHYGAFGEVRTNFNTTGYGHSFALASLARRYRDRWMQEGKKVTKFIVESTQSITFPSVEIDYLA